MDDFFKARLPISVKKSNYTKIVESPVLYNDPDAEVFVITDSPLSEKEVKPLISFLNNNLKIPFSIISALPYALDSDNEVKSVVKTYANEGVNLKNYIRPNSRIITLGRALYAITKSDDVKADCFADIIFNKTYIYSPELKSYVFPTYSLSKISGQQTWERHHAIFQCKEARALAPITPRVPTLKCNLVEDLEAFYKEHESDPITTIDIETSSLDFVTGEIGCVTMAFNGQEGFYLRWADILKVGVGKFSNFIKDKFQVYANGKFDTKFLLSNGVEREALKISFDTHLAGHVINEARYNRLKSHAWYYTYYGGYDKALDDFKEKHGVHNYLEIEESILMDYAVKDAIVTFQVFRAMKTQIEELDKRYPMDNGWSLKRYYYEIVIPSVNMFVDIEYRGVFVDTGKLEEESRKIQDNLEQIKKEFHDYTKTDPLLVNIESPEDLGKLFQKRGLPMIEVGKKGIYLSNDDILEKYVTMGYKEAEIIQRYRGMAIIQKTFVGLKEKNSGFWQYLKYHKEDGSYRIHSNYGVMLAESGRYTCKEPNMQNIPSHGEWASFVRGHFTVPSDEYVFMSVDYSGLQMRLATILSKDVELTDIFINQAGDVHSKTAAAILLANRVTLEEFLKIKKDSRPFLILERGDEKVIIPKEKYDHTYTGYRVLIEFVPSDLRFKSKACFIEGTKLETSEGALKVEDFIPETNPGEQSLYYGDILINEEPIESTFFDTATEFIKFELENGDSIEVTPDHKMIVIRDSKEIRVEAWEVFETDGIPSQPLVTTTKIKKITRVVYNESKKIYCVSVPPKHEVVVVGEKGKYRCGQCNFGLLFGKGAGSVMSGDIQPNWTKEQCRTYIKDNGLTLKEYKDKHDEFYTVALDIREKYFETYFGLEQWHKDTRDFASKHGYVRSIYGAFRRLPELLAKDDSKEGRARTANLLNICLNSPIQNMESVIVTRTMTTLHNFIKENGLKSYIFGTIHDAIELYVHRSEVALIREKLSEIAQFAHIEYNGIPIEVEGNIADPKNGGIWDCGIDWHKYKG